MISPFKRRGARPPTLGAECTDLCGLPLEQWQYVRVNERMFRKTILWQVGEHHEEDVWQMLLGDLLTRLRKDPPVENIRTYFNSMSAFAVRKHRRALAKRAELFVGDDTYLLDRPDEYVRALPQMRV